MNWTFTLFRNTALVCFLMAGRCLVIWPGWMVYLSICGAGLVLLHASDNEIEADAKRK